MTQVITKTQRLKDDNLMQYTENIITEMRKAIDVFPEPVPGLSSVEAALTAFRLSAGEAAYRDTRAIRIRNEKRKELEYLIRELSKYVDTVANRDATIILASGFVIRSDDKSYGGPAPKVGNPRVEPQEVGSSRVKVKVNPWRGARMYHYQFRKKGEMEWSSQLCSKSVCMIEGLERFQEYEFRATYIGINPTPNYSDIVSSYAV